MALAELTHLFGRLDPKHPGTAPTLRELTGIVADIPERRLSMPSPQAFGEAGMLAGLAARLSGRPHGQAALNDALLHLQAAEGGRMLVTRNAGDFGWLRRLSPRAEGAFVLTRRGDGGVAGRWGYDKCCNNPQSINT